MKELLFILTSTAYAAETLDIAPDGWDEAMVQWSRSKKYWGVFRAFTIPLKFVKRGAAIIRNEFYTYGTKGNVTVEIQRLNKQTLLYEVAYTGSVDLETFRDTDYSVEVNFMDSGIPKMLKDNEGTEYVLSPIDYPILWGGEFQWPFETTMLDPSWSDLKTVAYCLIDKITGGKLEDGTFVFKSDILDYYSIAAQSTATHAFRPVVISTGRMIGFPPNEPWEIVGYNITTSFNDFFAAIDLFISCGVWVGLEYDSVSGSVKETIRIEPKSYFFTPIEGVVALGACSSYSVTIDKELSFKNLKIGWAKQEYVNAFMKYEPNCESRWTTARLPGTTVLDMTSKYRTDSIGIKEIATTQTDVDANFMLELADILGHWEFKQDTKCVNSITSEEWYTGNGLFAPRSCLIANATILQSRIWNYVGQSFTFEMGDNDLRNMEQRIYEGGVTLPVKEPVLIGNTTYFLPFIIEIECALPVSFIDSINADPLRQASFTYKGITYYGWIMDVKAKLSGRSSGKIKLLSIFGNAFQNLIR